MRRWERGSSLAWTAALLTSVLVPLLLLAGDGSRLFMVYTRLGAATDLACAELGYLLANRQAFLTAGPSSAHMVAKPWAQYAAANFAQSMSGLNVPVTAHNFDFRISGNTVHCTGRVTFPLLLLAGQTVTLTQVGANKVRFIVP